jgi:hypothetical protein
VQYHTAFAELGCRREEIVDRHARIRPVFVKYIEGDASPCPACGGHVTDRPDQLGIEKPSTVVCLRCSRMDPCHDPAFANLLRASAVAKAALDETMLAYQPIEAPVDLNGDYYMSAPVDMGADDNFLAAPVDLDGDESDRYGY